MKKRLMAIGLSLLSTSAFAQECPSVLKFVKRKLNSQETVNLCEAYQGKTLLVVNTASYCGYTPQFEGLEAMYEKYKNDGLVILGFPSHDFNQEADNEEKTAELCELTYGVKFPMFEPTHVRGDDADPMYQMLKRATGEAPGWNFNKYLIDSEGNILEHYPASVKPTDPALLKRVESLLGA